MRKVEEIAIWGDSVMRGVIYDPAREKYVLLEENSADRASRSLGLRLRNRARMGCTITKGMTILKKDMAGGLQTDAALIEFGGNDCDFDWEAVAAAPEKEHQPKTPLGIFTSQLTDMVNMVKAKGISPLMMTLPPIHAQRYFDFFTRGGLSRENILRWLGDVQFIYRWHEQYNAAVVRVARQCGCLLADVREAFLSCRHYEELLCVDGIHPNAEGHALMESVLENFGLSLRRSGVIAG